VGEADSSTGSGRLAYPWFGLFNNPNAVSRKQEGVSGGKPDDACPDDYDVTCVRVDPRNTRQGDQWSCLWWWGRGQPPPPLWAGGSEETPPTIRHRKIRCGI